MRRAAIIAILVDGFDTKNTRVVPDSFQTWHAEVATAFRPNACRNHPRRSCFIA
jgi:hypothetical protein